MFPNTYYIQIENYTTVLAIYKIRAWTYEEAVKIAKERYINQLQISQTTKKEYGEFAEENYIELS